jgi:hypothetical protein
MMRMPDGSYYFGDFKEGKRHGAGINISEHGVIFEGEFFNNMRDGCGCMWGPSGPVYFGDILCNHAQLLHTITYTQQTRMIHGCRSVFAVCVCDVSMCGCG